MILLKEQNCDEYSWRFINVPKEGTINQYLIYAII